MKVKICGITNLEDALLAGELGADAVGFIFYKKSKRFVEFQIAKDIIASLPSTILKVGVFVNEDLEIINKISNEIKLTNIQLHGEETPEYTAKINLPAWKAFRVNTNFDFKIFDDYKNCTFMLDTFSEKEYGGTGKAFDWNIIPSKIKSEIVLAGGVSLHNIERIYKEISPAWVDVSSSLEKYPGKKDENKLKEFFELINKLRKK